MRALVVSIAAAASVLILSGDAFAKTAACPCSPCKCSPCTCGGGGKSGKSESKHKDKDKHGHSSVGVGVNVDLGGVGQRKTEADPFAPTNESHAPHTQEKPKTKKIDKNVDTTFERVELTSEKAKELEKPEEEEAGSPAGTINISDEKGESAGSPPPQTQEKEKKKKEKEPKKKKWPKPIQDWWDKKETADEAYREREYKRDHYTFERKKKFFDKSKRHGELEEKIAKIQGTLTSPLNKNSAAENDKLITERDDLKKELAKLEGDLEKDFQKTDEGKKALVAREDAEKAADDARKAEREAGKYIDQETKDDVQEAEHPSHKQEDRQEIH